MLRLFRLPNNYLAKYVTARLASYVQGQEPEPRIREYFYYIDHQGMLFLDDSKLKNFTSCFKEKKFLSFFFKRITINKTGRYQEEFPYVSMCGRERNFIRCDDVPIVYNSIINRAEGRKSTELLSYGHAGESLVYPFDPEKIYMLPANGRVYHPTEEKFGRIGLVMSRLAIQLSKHFEFNNGETNPPTHFTWNSKKYMLDQDWFHIALKECKIKVKIANDC